LGLEREKGRKSSITGEEKEEKKKAPERDEQYGGNFSGVKFGKQSRQFYGKRETPEEEGRTPHRIREGKVIWICVPENDGKSSLRASKEKPRQKREGAGKARKKKAPDCREKGNIKMVPTKKTGD